MTIVKMTCHKLPEHMPLTFIVVLILLVILCWLDTEHLQIPAHHPQIILLLKTAMMEVPVREIQSILKMKTKLGLYDPRNSEINFAVPDE